MDYGYNVVIAGKEQVEQITLITAQLQYKQRAQKLGHLNKVQLLIIHYTCAIPDMTC